MKRALFIAIPFLLLVPIAFGVAFAVSGQPFELLPLLAGAAGWFLALLLRAPVGIAGLRITGSTDTAQRWVVASSGPLEESVRLAALLLVGRDLQTALWLGLGWASIEVLYAIGNAFAVAALADRTDPEAQQAKAMLPPGALSSSAPLWGVVERAWASALHIGFTLILAAVPLLVVITAGVHTLVNVGMLWLLRQWDMLRAQAVGAFIGVVVFGIGLLLMSGLN